MSPLRRAAAIALAIGLSTSSAAAQPAIEQARIYFDAGAQAYAAGRYEAAIEALSAAYALAPKPQVLFSLAQAERRQFTVSRDPARLRDAVAHFRKYLDEVREGGRRADAVEALGELEALGARVEGAAAKPAAPARVTRVMISCVAKGAVVSIDGVAHQDVPVLEPVEPGKHRVRVTAPGFLDEEREITAVEGTLVPMEITLRERPSYLALEAPAGAQVTIDGRPFGAAPFAAPLDVAPGSRLVTVTRTGHEPSLELVDVARGETVPLRFVLRRTQQRKVSFGVLGAGLAGLLTGGALGIAALAEEGASKGVLDEARRGNISAARLDDYNRALAVRDTLRVGTAIAFAVAGLVTVTGLALYFFDDPRPTAAPVPRARPREAALAVGPGSLSLQARF